MGGYKTVTASDGYRFHVSDKALYSPEPDKAFFAQQYREYTDGTMRFWREGCGWGIGQEVWHGGMDGLDVELVEQQVSCMEACQYHRTGHYGTSCARQCRCIMRPALGSGHETVRASEGYEFRITSRDCCIVLYANEYRAYDKPGAIFFTDGNGVHQNWLNPTIELVKIEKPEADADARWFEFPWPDDGEKGDILCIDRKGRWSRLRRTPQTLTSFTGGQAESKWGLW